MKLAKKLLYGSYEEQYKILRKYLSELKKKNTNTTRELLPTLANGVERNFIIYHKVLSLNSCLFNFCLFKLSNYNFVYLNRFDTMYVHWRCEKMVHRF